MWFAFLGAGDVAGRSGLGHFGQHALNFTIGGRKAAAESRNPAARPLIFYGEKRQPDDEEKHTRKHRQKKAGGS